jgi:hypothetical protein
MAVRVLTPNQMESPHADFILTCGTVSTAPPQRGRFRISLTGFTCNRQTRDHFVEADGPADEIYQVPFVVAVERSGSTVLIPSRPGSPVGSHGPIFREIRSGASFPRTPCVLSPAPSRSGVPGVLFEGELIAGQKAVVIYPTLWEFDDDPVQLVVFQGACLAARNRVAAAAIPIMTSEIPRVRLSRTLSIVADRPLISVNIQREGDLDRPIGLEFGRDVPLHEVGDPIVVTATEPPPGSTIFRPRDLVFTYERAAADSTSGTPITIPYVDPRSHEGDYSLCIMVQRL